MPGHIDKAPPVMIAIIIVAAVVIATTITVTMVVVAATPVMTTAVMTMMAMVMAATCDSMPSSRHLRPPIVLCVLLTVAATSNQEN
jgi:hypothetical protein